MNKPLKTQRKTKIIYINKDDTKENIDIMKGYDCFTQTIG